MTLVGQVFTVTMVEVDPMSPEIGPESFTISGGVDIQPYEMIN
jgi:hypothetical protein